jgi:hypothetical protein
VVVLVDRERAGDEESAELANIDSEMGRSESKRSVGESGALTRGAKKAIIFQN